MSKSDAPMLFTGDGFKALLARHGFSQAQAGTMEQLNGYLCEPIRDVTRFAVLQADNEKHAGLHRDHAQTGLDEIAEVPKGIYG
jgi:hypothetical protein